MVAGDWVEIIIKLLALVFVLLTGFAYLTLFERRVLAAIQSRVGPDRVGPKGFLQPAADGLKLLFKEDIIPRDADRLLFMIAPIAVVITALMSVAVVPWGPDMTLFGREVSLALADINIGTLFFLGIGSLAVYGVVLAGWASNNKYALMGGIRASAQMLSYELAMGLSLLVPVMMAGSLNLGDIVKAQAGGWYVFLQPVAAIVFSIAVLAELQRSPFDLLEAEQELSAGFNVEYGGMRFGMFFMAEYMKMCSLSAIAATLFFGGYLGPFVDQVPALGFVYLFLKIVAGLMMMIWIRASFPRFRYDQLMSFGWKTMLPVAVLNFILMATFLVLREEGVFQPLVNAMREFIGS